MNLRDKISKEHEKGITETEEVVIEAMRRMMKIPGVKEAIIVDAMHKEYNPNNNDWDTHMTTDDIPFGYLWYEIMQKEE